MQTKCLLVTIGLVLCLFVYAQSKLHVFKTYNTAKLAPRQILHKEIPTNSILTYEFQCTPAPCDAFLLKNQDSYILWTQGDRNASLWFSTSANETVLGTDYHNLIQYRTSATEGPVFAIMNPASNTVNVDISYNYRFDTDAPNSLPIILGVVLSVVGCAFLVLVVFIIIVLIWICRRKKEYMPMFDGVPEF